MLAAFLVAAPARAQQNADCLACHGEKGFTTERKGRTVSLYVSEKAYAASVHGSVPCVDCHADLAGKELPHETTLAKVDCGACHDGRGEAARGVAARPGHRARRSAGARAARPATATTTSGR